ncbi:MAG TPA: HD-GYP domain-containing protein [Solirubrobacteraceae bacterium]|nr:HD-GYP domain-containing protein [Solirubrobacteraceae bacterium]
MTMQPTFEEQEILADKRRRASVRMTLREILGELLVGPGFFGCVALVWWIQPPHHMALAPAACCIAVMVLATRVLFETPFGFTVATQLAFVPMLFALPLAIVPLAFAGSLAISALPDVLAGRQPVVTLLRVPGNSWSSIFPCLLFAGVGVAPAAAGPPLLIGALAAQFVGDFAQSALYFGIARGAALRAQLRESWVYLIDAALSGVGLAVAEEMHSAPYAVLAMVPLLGLLAMFAYERRGRLGNLLELNETYRGTALLLGDVIAADDGYTGEHSQDVVSLAVAVGDQLGLDAEQRRNLEFGALLHDVGKIAIPKEIVNKPGKLDSDEWELMKTHTTEGERMLNQVGGFMREVGQIVRSHHERWDGRGYPDGLAGSTITLEARIIACCDSWNAMRTDRPYRRALTHEAAIGELLGNAGAQFDPAVVRATVRVVAAERPTSVVPVAPVPARAYAAGVPAR